MKTTKYYNQDGKDVGYWETYEYFVIVITGINTMILYGYADDEARV